jgi:5'(3')-deoxyribonucleotidase
MDKKDLIIDFDNTIANSSKRAYDMFKKNHKDVLKFSKSKLRWGFQPYANSDEERAEMLSYFSCEEFYKKLKWIDHYTKKAIKKLSKKYNIIICSMRNKNAYTPLIEWLEKNMPCEYQTCLLSSYDKGIVGRKGSIIIDDKPSCLTGNKHRSKKILFGTWGYQFDELNSMSDKDYDKFSKKLVQCKTWKDVVKEIY